MSRNVTISLPDELARWVRIRAAEADKSVSKYVSSVLEAEAVKDLQAHTSVDKAPGSSDRSESYWKAYREWKKLTPEAAERTPASISRDELYDRNL
jgi:hypothetical protein